MQQEKRWNNILGWAVGAIALVVYALTVEPTASFWDCGEFIAVSYKLEVSHPPGAPLFSLMARMFSFLALGDETQVAFWINMMSVVASALTITFLFWTITYLGRKLLAGRGKSLDAGQSMLVFAAGIIGSLAYTFTDSFWFSAVEAEVYATSSFFTAVVFWAMLKWDSLEDEAAENRWFIFLAYLIGLSIGVHLLNLVSLPALGLIWYFKKYPNNHKLWRIFAVLGVSGIFILLIMNGVIVGLPSIAGAFEVFFVNSVGLGFGSGALIFTVLFFGGLATGIIITQKRGLAILNTVLISATFVLIGYTSYAIPLIRSNYNPYIDENNPENVMSFISYLKREQYQSTPLLRGPDFTLDKSQLTFEEGAPIYTRGEDKYEIIGYKTDVVYPDKQQVPFTRMWHDDPRHIEVYQAVSGVRPGRKPKFKHHMRFMFSHQLGHMYMRYFMWNFVGRKSDIQNAGVAWPGNAFASMPDELANNKARNNYFALPLLLGLVGLMFQLTRSRSQTLVTGLFFVMTGIAIVVYLNSWAIEPRERDYAYVGSFYAFAIWIGLGTMALGEGLGNLLKSRQTGAIIAGTLCLVVPGIMAAQGWDDHNRSGRYYQMEYAKNTLESCPPNAVLFTGGDNDTFPLWYLQEVEGFRTDVRVVVTSYLNSAWNQEQLTFKMNDSEPLPFTLTPHHYREKGPNEQLFVYDKQTYDAYRKAGRPMVNVKNKTIEYKSRMLASNLLNDLARDTDQYHVGTSMGNNLNMVPSENLLIPMDSSWYYDRLPENLKSSYNPYILFQAKSGSLLRGDLEILDIAATGKLDRPMCFTYGGWSRGSFDYSRHLIRRGVIYQLLPVVNRAGELWDTEASYDLLMNTWYSKGLEDEDVYYNTEDYLVRNMSESRNIFVSLAEYMHKQEGDSERAQKLLERCLDLLHGPNMPPDHNTAAAAVALLEIDPTSELGKEWAITQGEAALELVNHYRDLNQRLSDRDLQLFANRIGQAYRAMQMTGDSEKEQYFLQEATLLQQEVLNRRGGMFGR